jgi:MerR family transcriptional regulator/heat shock protein HspR
MQNRPLYTIGVIADLLEVHRETLRVWEKHGLIKPNRRNGQRLYTDTDLKRLLFIQELLDKGLNQAGVLEYLSFYPCWLRDDCPRCIRRCIGEGCGKQCWKEKGIYCQFSLAEPSVCDNCEFKKSVNEEKIIKTN